MEGLEYLKQEVNKLKVLLDDPQPGCISWVMFLNERLENISNFWKGDIEYVSK